MVVMGGGGTPIQKRTLIFYKDVSIVTEETENAHLSLFVSGESIEEHHLARKLLCWERVRLQQYLW